MGETIDFEQFDVVSDNTDHHFARLNKKNETSDASSDCFTNESSDVYRRIMKEWKILAHNLPETIYVRVYENRVDLLRAMIVGVAGTPYHDGLFCFDIAFPPDYPNHPPKIHYCSYGLYINPNLYRNGKVCLSLINTWQGNKNEKWDPSRSTILQLLVSLQGLVLNDMPYFNEAGLEIFGRGMYEKRARAYNEYAFAHSCKSMLCLLQRPPQNFQGLVVAHFRSRGRAVLVACNDYANGRVRVGLYSETNEPPLTSCEKVSEKFKDWMHVLYPRLFSAFIQCGASLETGVEHLSIINESPKNMGNGKYKVIVKKVVGKIRKIYASTLKTRVKN
ncbi:hypothetical protein RJT34_32330 [Clitoria ternatea]|uniref:UBC core domain-containing protein n=1 Tax=Clitoria ternatea TaxID=43366 RepID=A0AAN9F031_CLITE